MSRIKEAEKFASAVTKLSFSKFIKNADHDEKTANLMLTVMNDLLVKHSKYISVKVFKQAKTNIDQLANTLFIYADVSQIANSLNA